MNTINSVNGDLTIETNDSDDRVNVTRNADTGEVTVNVNGTQHDFSATQAEHITIRTYGGKDVVNIAPDVQINTTIEAGDGDDIVAGGAGVDKIDGGAGNDTLIGGRGNDHMIGGDGNDRIQDNLTWIGANLGGGASLASKGIGPREGAGNDVVDGGNGNDRIDTGKGDDRINAGAGNDRVNAGEGEDTINGEDGDDRMQAGAGHDTVDAGKGNDYVDGSTGNDRIDGKEGADTLYGGDGDDTVDGGDGRDYIDGYLGNDVLTGGADNDVISGGRGEDSIFGNGGNDVAYTGGGRDFVGDYDGTNTVYYQGEDALFVNQATSSNAATRTVDVANVPDNIRIEGSPEFQARMRADLETLAASPTGRQMLAGIESQGDGWRIFGGNNHLTITELHAENGRGGGFSNGDGFAQINPAFHLDDDDGRVPPITVMYHELAHAYASMSGNWRSGTFQDNADPTNPDIGVNNAERQAVGLSIDHDNNPATPAIVDADWSPALTENAIRAEMGYGPRQDYN